MLCLTLGASGFHEVPASALPRDGHCVAPGNCTAPNTQYQQVGSTTTRNIRTCHHLVLVRSIAQVLLGPQPGQQWNINGGFCGAFSTQHAALAFGAWISQDLVRKANRNSAGPHNMQ